MPTVFRSCGDLHVMSVRSGSHMAVLLACTDSFKQYAWAGRMYANAGIPLYQLLHATGLGLEDNVLYERCTLTGVAML